MHGSTRRVAILPIHVIGKYLAVVEGNPVNELVQSSTPEVEYTGKWSYGYMSIGLSLCIGGNIELTYSQPWIFGSSHGFICDGIRISLFGYSGYGYIDLWQSLEERRSSSGFTCVLWPFSFHCSDRPSWCHCCDHLVGPDRVCDSGEVVTCCEVHRLL